MSYAQSTLIKAAALIGINPSLVNWESGSEDAKLRFSSDTIAVAPDREYENLIVAEFAPAELGYSFLTEPMEPNSEKLAGIIKEVIFEKLYSAAWVGYKVASQLDDSVCTLGAIIHDRDIVTITLSSKDDNGNTYTTLIDVVATVGNGPYNYCYTLYSGDTIFFTTDNETDLDQLVSALVKAIERHYETWKRNLG